MSDVKQEDGRLAKPVVGQGQGLILKILIPREVQGGDTVPISGIVLKPDGDTATRLEMYELARDLVSKAYTINSLPPALPTILKAVIEGQDLYEYSIGEFFQLYGEFRGKYRVNKDRDIRVKMRALLNGDPGYLKTYVERSGQKRYPLPYVVRQILVHGGGTYPNSLDDHGEAGKDLSTSIQLLRSWVSSGKGS